MLRLLLLLAVAISPSLALSDEGRLLLQAFPPSAVPGWNPLDATPCNWTGVRCSLPAASVTSLDLPALDLSGPFPPSLCRLPRLSRLSLPSNLLSSTLPSRSLLPCPALAHLDLSSNLFVGPLPSLLHLLPSLLHLDLSGNNFSGAIPPSFALFPVLRNLSLVNNLLTSPIPSFLSNLTSLRQLNLSYNPFAPAPVPPELGNLTSLDTLWLASCNLVGPIPASLGALASLRNLDLSGNALTGPIPASLGALRCAFQIELYGNSLSGEIPAALANLTALQNLDASMNRLVGGIPGGLFELPLLESLNLYDNNLTGSLPDAAAGAARLVELRLFGNRLTGPLPRALGARSPLQLLDLSQNLLSGEIPAGLCATRRLQELMLIDNSLSGAIPESLAGCRTLTRLRLRGNLLSGAVPGGFWGLPHLYLLDLAGNSLAGPIGAEIRDARNLSSVLISGNRFTGTIPESVGSLPKLYELSAANNRLSGPLPRSIGSLRELGKLDLHNNQITGELPEIAAWTRLTELNLAGNRLTGAVPSRLSSLPVLNYLDLSNNLLTGPVPPELQNLTLNHLNLSGNGLTGLLPPLFAAGVYRASFLGNPGLCEGPCRAAGAHGAAPWLFRSLLAAAAAVLALGSACLAWRYKRFRDARREQEKSKWTLTSFHKLGFSEYEILDCLDEDNVVGSGGAGKVYKAVLSNGEAVAVKKLWGRGGKDGEGGGRFDGFDAEVATLGKIRHKNIVKLWCCCAHRDCKLLVYEYMPNGSLGDFLHSTKAGVLGWELRRRIALEAAEGLSYLHHDCVPPIVHRDVKSNNILLDAAFGAKLSDFGVAKEVEPAGKVVGSMSGIAGSCGYIAPEYAYTLRVSEKSDIYSFGVVLLELVTGRAPVDPEFGEKDLVKWVCSTLEQKGVEHVIDPKLDRRFKDEARRVLDVALQCASSLPINRPSMRMVVKMLQHVDADGGDRLPCYYYNEDSSEQEGGV